MKKTSALLIVCLLVLGFFVGKYFLEHRTGYGAIDYTNTAIPSDLLFTEKEEIPDAYRIPKDYQDIQQVGGMFSDQFFCQKLGKNAETVQYWKQTAGYGISGGWSYRFAVVCGEEYLVVYGADHLGELLYGPFTRDAVENSAQSLDLRGRGLLSVPSDIFRMTDLTSLDVSENNLSGALPGEIRFLKNLQTLDASDNAMTGVPAEIGQLSQLQYLDLSNNALTGLPNELGKLTSLIRLDLRGNAISPQDLDGIRAMLSKTEILVD